MNAILDDLTDAQREAVTHIRGPLLVVAGPGSGKTRVITRRVAHLLYCGIHPWNVLAITFTNKAAGEMRQRVRELVGDKGVWVSTFHAFCAGTLRRFGDRVGYGRDFTIYDSDDSRRAITAICKELELSKDTYKPSFVQEAIGVFKRALRTPREAIEDTQSIDDPKARKLAMVYERYQALLRNSNCMDFDDLLMQTAVLMQTDTDALERLRKRHEFVMIDEFQDTNRSQYEIARLLATNHRNLAASGDPDQSIYGWRGANIRNMLDFDKDFPEAKVVFLDRNYRSTQTIIAAADTVVANNLGRKPRKLYTTNPEGESIRLFEADDDKEEAQLIAERIVTLIRDGASPGDIAVFYRVSWLSRRIEEALIGEGIPYQIVGGVEFYNRKEVKDIVAYLRLVANPADETSLLRIINVPQRRVGARSVEKLKEWSREHKVRLIDAIGSPEGQGAVSAVARGGLERLVAVLDRIKAASTEGAAAAVAAAVKATDYIGLLRSSGKEADKGRVDNLQELANAAAEFDANEENNALEAFLDQAALVSDIDSWHEEEPKATLMTMHAAKGLEFPMVFICGLEETILPHERSMWSQDKIEEERRLFFVAMTRAKERLFLSTAGERMIWGSYQCNAPSRFIREIPKELVEHEGPSLFFAPQESPAFSSGGGRRAKHAHKDAEAGSALPSPGTRVLSKAFGPGVVQSVTPQGPWHKATVKFAHAGVKKLILEKANLEIVDG